MPARETAAKSRGSQTAAAVKQALSSTRARPGKNADESQLLDAGQRHQQIAEAAYFIAEARGFVPGRMMEDWLAAEQQIDAGLLDTGLPERRS